MVALSLPLDGWQVGWERADYLHDSGHIANRLVTSPCQIAQARGDRGAVMFEFRNGDSLRAGGAAVLDALAGVPAFGCGGALGVVGWTTRLPPSGEDE